MKYRSKTLQVCNDINRNITRLLLEDTKVSKMKMAIITNFSCDKCFNYQKPKNYNIELSAATMAKCRLENVNILT